MTEDERQEHLRMGVLAVDVAKHPCPPDLSAPFPNPADERDYQSTRLLMWEVDGLLYSREDWLEDKHLEELEAAQVEYVEYRARRDPEDDMWAAMDEYCDR